MERYNIDNYNKKIHLESIIKHGGTCMNILEAPYAPLCPKCIIAKNNYKQCLPKLQKLTLAKKLIIKYNIKNKFKYILSYKLDK